MVKGCVPTLEPAFFRSFFFRYIPFSMSLGQSLVESTWVASNFFTLPSVCPSVPGAFPIDLSPYFNNTPLVFCLFVSNLFFGYVLQGRPQVRCRPGPVPVFPFSHLGVLPFDTVPPPRHLNPQTRILSLFSPLRTYSWLAPVSFPPFYLFRRRPVVGFFFLGMPAYERRALFSQQDFPFVPNTGGPKMQRPWAIVPRADPRPSFSGTFFSVTVRPPSPPLFSSFVPGLL